MILQDQRQIYTSGACQYLSNRISLIRLQASKVIEQLFLLASQCSFPPFGALRRGTAPCGQWIHSMPQQFVVSFCLVGSQLPAAPCIQCQHGHPAEKICTAARLVRTLRSMRLMRFTRAGQRLAARDIQ